VSAWSWCLLAGSPNLDMDISVCWPQSASSHRHSFIRHARSARSDPARWRLDPPRSSPSATTPQPGPGFARKLSHALPLVVIKASEAAHARQTELHSGRALSASGATRTGPLKPPGPWLCGQRCNGLESRCRHRQGAKRTTLALVAHPPNDPTLLRFLAARARHLDRGSGANKFGVHHRP